MVTTAMRRLSARTATIPIIRMLVRLMATTDLAGSMAASLLAPDRGFMDSTEATGAAAVTTDVAATAMDAAATGTDVAATRTVAAVMPRTPMQGAELQAMRAEAGMHAAEQSRADPLAAGIVEALAVDSPAVEAVASMAVVDLTEAGDPTAVAAMAAGTGN